MNLSEWKDLCDKLRGELQSLVPSELPERHRPEAWTARQVYNHVLMVDESSATLLERLVAKARDLVPRPAGDAWPFRNELMDFPLDTAFSVPAFRGTEPKKNVSDKELARLNTSTRVRMLALAELASEKVFDGVSFPHPLAGRMNFYEWLVFGCIHEGLHLRQLKTDLSGPAY